MENLRASELRIGNFVNQIGFSVQDGYPPNYKKLDQIKEAKQIDFSVYMEPIPLTEEWLLKFGFIIHEDGYITCPNGRQWILHLDNEFEFEALNIIVIYVHQLQNLYFALTGEELIINN